MSVRSKPSIVFVHGIWADGCFAGDLSEAEQKVVGTTHAVPAADLFNQKVEGTATSHEIDSSHLPMLSNPGLVVDVIRTAASAVQLR